MLTWHRAVTGLTQDIMVGSDTGSRQITASQTESRDKLPLSVTVLIIGLVIPYLLSVGGLRLSVYRFVLLVTFFPVLFALLSGKVGRLKVPDICVILICVWSIISITVVHGLTGQIEGIGILVLETLGAYLIGRVGIRTPEAFRKMVKLFFVLTLIVLPFAIFETLTARNIILELFDKIGTTYTDVYKEARWGLDRVQGPFAHPIHTGVVFGCLVGVTFYVLGYGQSAFGKLSRTAVVVLGGGLALSSGPLTALVAQLYFITWDVVFRNFKSRWYAFAGLAASIYIAIDLLSNRNPFQVFVTYLAFSSHTAYGRLIIWDQGTKSIYKNPVFGVGFGDWERYYWLSESVDMFWILPAMRHGIPLWILWFLLFFWIFFQSANAKISDPKVQAYRTGYLSTLLGLFLAGWTVHYWDATLVLITFLFGSGMWIKEYEGVSAEKEGEIASDEITTKPGVRYSRFDARLR